MLLSGAVSLIKTRLSRRWGHASKCSALHVNSVSIYVQMSVEHTYTHTHAQHLQREPRQSLRRSMRNKYLIAGWPTSCALKSYLSVSASIMAAASYLRPCSADAARDNFKKEPEETKEPARPLIQSLLALTSLAPGCLARWPTCDLHELLS